MQMSRSQKYDILVNFLKSYGSCAVAFSGGVDSTFLLWAAREALGDSVTALTASAPYMPKEEICEAGRIAETIGVRHAVLEIPLNEEIRFNPDDRCFRCKKLLFSAMKAEADRRGIPSVLDGSNLDDLQDYRPGMKALKKLNIPSPLLEQRWGKKEIRKIGREIGLPNWQKAPGACLLSRMPYGHEITLRELDRIEKAENYLRESGFRCVRVRSHGNLARIEVDREERRNFFQETILDDVSRALKALGYVFVALELEGYETGNMNRSLLKSASS